MMMQQPKQLMGDLLIVSWSIVVAGIGAELLVPGMISSVTNINVWLLVSVATTLLCLLFGVVPGKESWQRAFLLAWSAVGFLSGGLHTTLQWHGLLLRLVGYGSCALGFACLFAIVYDRRSRHQATKSP